MAWTQINKVVQIYEATTFFSWIIKSKQHRGLLKASSLSQDSWKSLWERVYNLELVWNDD